MKIFLKVILLIILGASILNLLKVVRSDFLPDFSVFYHSASQAIRGVNFYQPGKSFIDGYLYTPVSLLLFYPLLLFPFLLAGKIWTITSLICLGISVSVLFRFYQEKDFFVIVIGSILVCNYFPVKFTLGMGQINILLLLLLIGALYSIRRKAETAEGVFIGLTLLMKYFPLFLPLYFLGKREWKTLGVVIATVLVGFIIGFIFMRPFITWYYLSHTVQPMVNSWKDYYYNQALSGFLQREFPHAAISLLTITKILLSLIIISLSLFVILKRKKSSLSSLPIELSISIIVSLLLNTFSWQHHFTMFLLPLGITYYYIYEKKLDKRWYILLGIVYFLTASNIGNPSAVPSIIQSHVFYGAVLLWIMNLYFLARS